MDVGGYGWVRVGYGWRMREGRVGKYVGEGWVVGGGWSVDVVGWFGGWLAVGWLVVEGKLTPG